MLHINILISDYKLSWVLKILINILINQKSPLDLYLYIYLFITDI